MRKITLLGLIVGLVALAVPAVASANAINSGSDCDYTSQGGNTPVGTGTVGEPGGHTAQLDVYTGPGSTGNNGTSAVGVCGNVASSGGFIEAGNGSQGTYIVADGSDGNPPGPAQGYMGLSNYEDGASRDPSCDGASNGAAGSTNSGGCFGVKPPVGQFVPLPSAVPTPMCGDTSGPDWNKTQRDGCFIP